MMRKIVKIIYSVSLLSHRRFIINKKSKLHQFYCLHLY